MQRIEVDRKDIDIIVLNALRSYLTQFDWRSTAAARVKRYFEEFSDFDPTYVEIKQALLSLALAGKIGCDHYPKSLATVDNRLFWIPADTQYILPKKEYDRLTKHSQEKYRKEQRKNTAYYSPAGMHYGT